MCSDTVIPHISSYDTCLVLDQLMRGVTDLEMELCDFNEFMSLKLVSGFLIE